VIGDDLPSMSDDAGLCDRAVFCAASSPFVLRLEIRPAFDFMKLPTFVNEVLLRLERRLA
jgi:hypothetical protein